MQREEDITKERDTLLAQIEDIKSKANGFLVESGDVDFVVNSFKRSMNL